MHTMKQATMKKKLAGAMMRRMIFNARKVTTNQLINDPDSTWTNNELDCGSLMAMMHEYDIALYL